MATRVGDSLPPVLERARQRQAERAVRPGPTGRNAKVGRPTRLHEGLIDRIVDVIEDGAPIVHACSALGIPESTYHSWKARGRQAQSVRDQTGACPEGERIYLTFLERTEEARATAAVQVVGALKRLALGETVSEIEVVLDEETEEEVARIIRFEKPSERAMEFYLERGHPDLYAKRVEVSGPDQSAIPVEVEVSARESIRKRLGQVGKRLLPDESEAS
jgi:hypothetical protein